MTDVTKYLISAAIDFGTTFSGYAFSSISDYKLDPTKIFVENWPAGHYMSLKTSTCVLFDPSGNFSKFGYEAEDKYTELASEEQHEKWYYFRRFKMQLYGEKTIDRNTIIKDEVGKTMAAMKVFSAGIKYLKDKLLETCKNQLCGISADDIRWVVTVPAIWSDSAKQFMRESAKQAGIATDQLSIALEPEAASLYCRHLPIIKDSHGELSVFEPGSQYLVLDAGGTIDITVHKVQPDKSLKETHKANGGDWGGTKVDDAFQNFLCEIVGNKAYDNFCREDRFDMLDLFRQFEVKKRSFNPDDDGSMQFKIPMTLNECYKTDSGKDIKEKVEANSTFKDNVNVFKDKLRVKPKRVKDMFKEATNYIKDHLILQLRNPNAKNVTSILMVGGFSESRFLQNIIRSTFEKLGKKVIIPQETGLAVLKGAVIYGHEPRIIKSRICKFTYGIKADVIFEPNTHPKSKRWVTKDGRVNCNDILHIHVRVNDEVNVGEPQVSKKYSVVETDQTSMSFEVWTSHQWDPEYVTDDQCRKLGSLIIEMPDTSRGLNRSANVQMTFGDTELKVKATDTFTGKFVKASFDFLKL